MTRPRLYFLLYVHTDLTLRLIITVSGLHGSSKRSGARRVCTLDRSTYLQRDGS